MKREMSVPHGVNQELNEAETHIVYMLRCRDNTLYTGYTNDLPARIKKHETGKGAKYTRGRGPFTVVYRQCFANKEQAMRHEAALKKLNRRQKLRLIGQKDLINPERLDQQGEFDRQIGWFSRKEDVIGKEGES